MSKIFKLILVLMLSLPISVWAVGNIDSIESTPTVETTKQEIISNDENILTEQPSSLKDNSQFKQPISKRKLAKKFIVGMGAVVASSLILFFGLTIYNRIREAVLNGVKTPEGEISLQTPDDLRCAIKTFLDKTSWKN